MKKLLSALLLTLSALSLTSCMKSHTCSCPPGTSVSVSTNDDSKIDQLCQSQSGGRCTR